MHRTRGWEPMQTLTQPSGPTLLRSGGAHYTARATVARAPHGENVDTQLYLEQGDQVIFQPCV